MLTMEPAGPCFGEQGWGERALLTECWLIRPVCLSLPAKLCCTDTVLLWFPASQFHCLWRKRLSVIIVCLISNCFLSFLFLCICVNVFVCDEIVVARLYLFHLYLLFLRSRLPQEAASLETDKFVTVTKKPSPLGTTGKRESCAGHAAPGLFLCLL